MTAPTPPDTPNAMAQLQSRLLNLTGQLDDMQQQLHQLTTTAQQSSEQVSSLTRNLTDLHATEAIHEQLATLATQMEEGRDLLRGVADQMARLAQVSADTTADARAALSQEMREQLDALAHTVAKQEQMERLIQMVASEERVSNLADEVQMLIRTQLKANALLESKDAQVAGALRTLQEIATRHDALQSGQSDESLQRLNEIRQTARAELAADLLPAIDGLEEALESGQEMVAHLITRRNERRAQRRRHQAARQQQAAAAQAIPDRRPGLFGWMRRNAPPTDAPLSPPAPMPSPAEDGADRMDTQHIETVERWLRALKLIHDRFLSLLAAESIEPIAAQDQPFDPHLHAAVDTERTDAAPPDTVLRVLRTGYRQNNRVLRYAEVIVARPATPPPASVHAAPSLAEENDEKNREGDAEADADAVSAAGDTSETESDSTAPGSVPPL